MKKYRIVDGSYSIEITPDGVPRAGAGTNYRSKTYKVLLHGSFPSTDYYRENENTILVKGDDGSLVFTQLRFMRIIQTCPHCGKEI